jgi:tRNA 2-thiouridine synthesizing protein D
MEVGAGEGAQRRERRFRRNEGVEETGAGMQRGALTFALMDPSSDCVRTALMKRLIEIAVRRGHDINVFAYKGETHPECNGAAPRRNGAAPRQSNGAIPPPPQANGALPRDWIESLMQEATTRGVKVDWVDCGWWHVGGDPVLGVRRGSPADFWDMAAHSQNMIVVSTP